MTVGLLLTGCGISNGSAHEPNETTDSTSVNTDYTTLAIFMKTGPKLARPTEVICAATWIPEPQPDNSVCGTQTDLLHAEDGGGSVTNDMRRPVLVASQIFSICYRIGDGPTLLTRIDRTVVEQDDDSRERQFVSSYMRNVVDVVKEPAALAGDVPCRREFSSTRRAADSVEGVYPGGFAQYIEHL